MNRDFIIRDEAKQFNQGIRRIKYQVNPHIVLKEELELKLYDFDENEDKLIFIYEVLKHLQENYEKHLVTCGHKDNPENCSENLFYLKSIFFVEQSIKQLNPAHDFKLFRPHIKADLINENLIGLSKFPESAKLYQDALDKLNENRFERNLLDDLRLSLEKLISQLLDNNKSLENQNKELGLFLKNSGSSKESTNMLRVLIDYFTKYQNTHIKHNDKVRKEEIDLITNLTSSFMSFLLNMQK